MWSIHILIFNLNFLTWIKLANFGKFVAPIIASIISFQEVEVAKIWHQIMVGVESLERAFTLAVGASDFQSLELLSDV